MVFDDISLTSRFFEETIVTTRKSVIGDFISNFYSILFFGKIFIDKPYEREWTKKLCVD